MSPLRFHYSVVSLSICFQRIQSFQILRCRCHFTIWFYPYKYLTEKNSKSQILSCRCHFTIWLYRYKYLREDISKSQKLQILHCRCNFTEVFVCRNFKVPNSVLPLPFYYMVVSLLIGIHIHHMCVYTPALSDQ